jgi:uncharacterized membrane protein (UPF0127 family)
VTCATRGLRTYRAGVRLTAPAELLVLLGALPLAGCTDGSAAQPQAAAPPDERVRAVLDGVELELEVADDGAERSVGLQRRTSVPPGTGMVFLYDEPVTGRYWMYDVPVPLRAVFVRNDRVVSSVLMPPCESEVAQSCPTYGPDEPYDTVVETAPETLPDVQPGDLLELGR